MLHKNLHIILLFLVGFFLPSIAFSQELKICENGINKCQPLIKDAEKYKACMVEACPELYNKNEVKKVKDKSEIAKEISDKYKSDPDPRPIVEARSCEYGLRKCDSLKNEKEYYWECMTEECQTPPEKFEASCRSGHLLCKPEMEEYLTCLGFNCPKRPGSVTQGQECAQGKQVCINNFDYFWHCVYAICLGPVERYKRPATTRKFIYTDDKKGNKVRVMINDNSNIKTYLEKQSIDIFLKSGIDVRELSAPTPQKYMSTGNPSNDLECLSGSMLRCKSSNDLRSCYCMDGTMPIFTKGLPDPRYGK